eukprot:5371519-Pyramimonas_sp.AAC.1
MRLPRRRSPSSSAGAPRATISGMSLSRCTRGSRGVGSPLKFGARATSGAAFGLGLALRRGGRP